ncbi:hypothetical protein [Rhizomonospora bruguierae]|uniref:hypothetical protein n=1 Tax=Rhizomonospora bruguierae TaxID=1581705 RepID=UPI001BCC24A2|nr:hypothetical protein [Micromonospora sp. NBRC 107566]
MVRPSAGNRGGNGRPARFRFRPRAPRQRSGNRMPYPDERAQPQQHGTRYGAEADDPRVEPTPPNEDDFAPDERPAGRDAPPLAVVLGMTRGNGPIAGPARALGIALLASGALVLACLIALVLWALKALL